MSAWTAQTPNSLISTRPLANGYRASIHRVAPRVFAWTINKDDGTRFHNGTTVSRRDALGAVAAIAIFNGLMDENDPDVYMALG